ncbi:MAG: hypothetical protein V4723_17735 [Pseudomonadota bacterium]
MPDDKIEQNLVTVNLPQGGNDPHLSDKDNSRKRHDLEKKNIPAVNQASHSKGLQHMLSGSNPVMLGEDPPDGGDSGIALGTLTITPADNGKVSIEENTVNGPFDIVYTRPDSESPRDPASNLQADDAAMIARVFMLAKLAAARLEMRDILLKLTERMDLINDMTSTEDGAPFAQTMLARLEAEEHEAPVDRTGGWDQASPKPPHRIKVSAPATWKMEDALAHAMRNIRENLRQYAGRRNFALLCTFAWTLVWIWIPIWDDGKYEPILAPVLGFILLLLGIFFVLNALNLKTIKERLEEKVHEAAVEKLDELLASLVQNNVNVAALNVKDARVIRANEQSDVPGYAERLTDALDGQASYVGITSEALLQRMDQTLHMKERLNSIEAVIKARQTHVLHGAKHIKDHRDRVRRSIAAGGSGVFVGFFTYEVGESVMEYMHVTHQQDSSAMMHWLIANGPRISGQSKPNQGHLSAGSTAAYTTGAQPKLDLEFARSFHTPQLYAHSMLLTITIVVSVLTAWIAMRKPASEQAGAHGHH